MIGWLRYPALWLNDEQRRQSLGSLCASAVIHVGALALCGLWFLRLPLPQETRPIETTWREKDLTAPSLEPVSITVSPDTDPAGGSIRLDPGANNLDPGVSLDTVSLTLPMDELESGDVQLLTRSLGHRDGGSSRDVEVTSTGTGTNASSGDGAGRGFFGLSADNKRVVFVVDASRSMNHPHPGPTKTRFGRVKWELVQSIGQMGNEQQFFIVFFNERAIPMPARILKAAYPETQDKYLRWAVQVKAEGKTDPQQALLLALSLEPDVIYFLTDGDFPRRVVSEVSRRNRKGIVINTIGFGDDEGEELLRVIASQNGGTYQFISGDDAN